MSGRIGFSLQPTAVVLLFLTVLFHSTPSTPQVAEELSPTRTGSPTSGPVPGDGLQPERRRLFEEFLEWKQRQKPNTLEPPSAVVEDPGVPNSRRVATPDQTSPPASAEPARAATRIAPQKPRIAGDATRRKVRRPGASFAAAQQRVRAPPVVATVAGALQTAGQRVGSALTCLVARGCISPARLTGTVVGAAAGGAVGGAGGAVAGGVLGAVATAPRSPLVTGSVQKRATRKNEQ